MFLVNVAKNASPMVDFLEVNVGVDIYIIYTNRYNVGPHYLEL